MGPPGVGRRVGRPSESEGAAAGDEGVHLAADPNGSGRVLVDRDPARATETRTLRGDVGSAHALARKKPLSDRRIEASCDRILTYGSLMVRKEGAELEGRLAS